MKKKKLFFVLILFIIAGCIFGTKLQGTTPSQLDEAGKQVYLDGEPTSQPDNFIYLSDLDYLPSHTRIGYGTYRKDTNISGGIITLKKEGQRVSYKKGIGAHATSTVIFDVSAYSDKYERLVAKAGVDASMNGGGEVWFSTSVSNDLVNWTELYKSHVVTSNSDCIEIDVNIKGYKYLSLYVDANGGNGRDHSVFGDAKLVVSEYNSQDEVSNIVQPISEYNSQITQKSYSENIADDIAILEREFVERVGYWTIQNQISMNSKAKNAIEYLLNDYQALKLWIDTGNIKDGALAIQAFSDLYDVYKDEIGDSGDALMYKKMIIAQAIAYSSDGNAYPFFLDHKVGSYDVVERFALMKMMYDQNLWERKDEFKTYNQELLRTLFNHSTYNDEIVWLYNYSVRKFPNINQRFSPYSYMPYVSPNYLRDSDYDEANHERFSNKYYLDEFNIPYGLDANGKKTPRTWMVFENGGVCFNMSRVIQNVYKVNGIPSTGTYQPGHEAILSYRETSPGVGVWDIGYNIYGWGKSYSTWGGLDYYRMLLNWNGHKYASKSEKERNYASSYLLLAQGALNDKTAFDKANQYYLLSKAYDDIDTKIELLDKSLDEQKIFLDSYVNLIDLYSESSKSSSEWRSLAERIIDAYKFYPMALEDLLQVVMPKLNNDDQFAIELQRTDALTSASKTTESEALQYAGIREVAKAILGDSQTDLATFSFSGDKANTIVLNEKYANYNFEIKYSLDNEQTWTAKEFTEADLHEIRLTDNEVQQINENDDIKIMITGLGDVFTINIEPAIALSSNDIVQNDLENRLVGKSDLIQYLEYTTDPSNSQAWHKYDENTRFDDDMVVYVRYMAHDNRVAGQFDSANRYTFTADNYSPTRKYLYLENVQLVHSGGHASGYDAVNMLDGNKFSAWHSPNGQVATDKTYIVAFDRIRFISAIEYTPYTNGNTLGNGQPNDLEIYTSFNGEDWVLAKTVTFANDRNIKQIDFDESVEAKYIKLNAVSTHGREPNKYISGSILSFFEDTTKTPSVTSIRYSNYSPTSQDVIATLDLGSGHTADITEHIFTQNGTHTFVYYDANGDEQTIIAEVNNIDKEKPTADVEYDLTEQTSFAVTARLVNITKNATVIGLDDASYKFTENGTYIFYLQDSLGNIGEVEAKVDWIVAEQSQDDDTSDEDNVDDDRDDSGNNSDNDDGNNADDGSNDGNVDNNDPSRENYNSNDNTNGGNNRYDNDVSRNSGSNASNNSIRLNAMVNSDTGRMIANNDGLLMSNDAEDNTSNLERRNTSGRNNSESLNGLEGAAGISDDTVKNQESGKESKKKVYYWIIVPTIIIGAAGLALAYRRKSKK